MSDASRIWATPEKTLVGIVLALSGFIAGTVYRDTNKNPKIRLAVDPSQLDFGAVFVQRDFRWKLDISNQADKEATITGFRTSCGCSSITPKALTIPPNSTRSIEIALDLRSDDEEGAERASRPFSVDVLPIGDSVVFQPSGWTVHGEVRSVVAVGKKPFLVEREIVRGTEMVPSTRFTIMPLVPVQAVGCDFDASLGFVEFGNAKDGAIRLAVRPNASLPAGTYEWDVGMRVQDEHGANLPVRALIVFRIVEDVVCTPSTVLLGVVSIGESAEAVLRLVSRTGSRFGIVSASAEASDDLKVDVGVYAEEPTVEARIRVTQQISRGGSQCSRIRILVRAENDHEGVELVVPVLYHGLTGAERSIRLDTSPASTRGQL